MNRFGRAALVAFVCIFSVALQAQQWTGNNDTTSNLWRSGNVGIGADPLYPFTVKVAGSVLGSSSPVRVSAAFYSNAGSGNGGLMLGWNTAATSGALISSATDGTMGFWGWNAAALTWSEWLHIDSKGFLGLRTATPRAPMDFGARSGPGFVMSPGATQTFDYTGFTGDDLVVGTRKYGTGSQHILSFGMRGSSQPRYLAIGSANSSSSTFDANTTFDPSLTVSESGMVGIGTANPVARLHVTTPYSGNSVYAVVERTTTSSDGALLFRTTNGSSDWVVGRSGTLNSESLAFWTGANSVKMVLTLDGNLGLGTTNPAQRLHVAGSAQVDGAMRAQLFHLVTPAAASVYSVVERNSLGTDGAIMFRTAGGAGITDWLVGRSASLNTENLVFWPLAQTGQAPPLMMTLGGTVAMGVMVPDPTKRLHVAGEVRIDGNTHVNGTLSGTNVRANYQDLAEWVPATDDLAPGTVVVLSRHTANKVTASYEPYDTRVAGVVSAQPGIILGVEGDGMEKVATTGRVKVRVDATRLPIEIGDLLVTSAIEGTAMKSEPMLLNGRKFHEPGTIIGKALEPLQSGTGEILVLLSMQ